MILMLSMLFSLIPSSLVAMENSVLVTIHPPAKTQTHTESSPLIPKDKHASCDSVPQTVPLYKRCDRGVGICLTKLCPVMLCSVLFFGILYCNGDNKPSDNRPSQDTPPAKECIVLRITDCGTCTKDHYSCAIPSQYFTQELQARLNKELGDTCDTDVPYSSFRQDCDAGDATCTPAAFVRFSGQFKKEM